LRGIRSPFKDKKGEPIKYETSQYHTCKSTELVIYSKEDERIAKEEQIQSYDANRVRYELRLKNSHLNIMREGDYLYHQADKQYYPFVRSEEERVKNSQSEDSDEISFIRNHVDILKKVIQQFEEQGLLLLDKRIYSRDGKFVNKSIRMNSDIYEEFSGFCEEYYPHLKTQDLIAQALIDAMKRYKPQS